MFFILYLYIYIYVSEEEQKRNIVVLFLIFGKSEHQSISAPKSQIAAKQLVWLVFVVSVLRQLTHVRQLNNNAHTASMMTFCELVRALFSNSDSCSVLSDRSGGGKLLSVQTLNTMAFLFLFFTTRGY